MPLLEYFRLARRWGWLLVLAALLGAGVAYGYSKLQTPIYQATLSVGIQPTRPDLSLTTSAQTLLAYYVSVIHTQTYAQKVITDLQLDRTPASLLGDVTISADTSRFVITINVKNTNGDTANDIARYWAAEFKAWRDDQNAQVQLTDKVDALILDSPKYVLYRPTTRVNVLAGALLGLLLGGVIVFAAEYLAAGVIRSRADIDLIQLPVLGAIPAEAAAAGRDPGPRAP